MAQPPCMVAHAGHKKPLDKLQLLLSGEGQSQHWLCRVPQGTSLQCDTGATCSQDTQVNI